MKNNVKILSGKGNEWSEAAASIMDTLAEWLSCSGISKEELIKRIEHPSFRVDFSDTEQKSVLSLCDKDGEIGEPFYWEADSGIPKDHFLTDAGFLLLHICSLCTNEKCQKKLNDFVCQFVI